MEYLSVEEGREQDGLRLVLVAGTPGAWGECVKAVYHVKGIEYKPVAQLMGQENAALREWTGQTSAPVAALNDERIRISWEAMLWQAEQLQPEPRLIPEDAAQRVAMFGLLREFAGECGFAWDRRLQSIAASGGPGASPVLALLGAKYGYSEPELEASYLRVGQLLELCSDILEQQQARGSRYFIGDSLTAVDIYAAVMLAIMINPLPEADIPMPSAMRYGFSQHHPSHDRARDILWEHRQYIFDKWLKLPLEF
jgi:glutathione S-transferase